MDSQTQLSKVLAGAAIGAGFAFLFLTTRGHRFLDNAEPASVPQDQDDELDMADDDEDVDDDEDFDSDSESELEDDVEE